MTENDGRPVETSLKTGNEVLPGAELFIIEDDYIKVGEDNNYARGLATFTWNAIYNTCSDYNYDKQRLQSIDPKRALSRIVKIWVDAYSFVDGLYVGGGKMSADVLRDLLTKDLLRSIPRLDKRGIQLTSDVVDYKFSSPLEN